MLRDLILTEIKNKLASIHENVSIYFSFQKLFVNCFNFFKRYILTVSFLNGSFTPRAYNTSPSTLEQIDATMPLSVIARAVPHLIRKHQPRTQLSNYTSPSMESICLWSGLDRNQKVDLAFLVTMASHNNLQNMQSRHHTRG